MPSKPAGQSHGVGADETDEAAYMRDCDVNSIKSRLSSAAGAGPSGSSRGGVAAVAGGAGGVAVATALALNGGHTPGR